jgi:hypothetical protein
VSDADAADAAARLVFPLLSALCSLLFIIRVLWTIPEAFYNAAFHNGVFYNAAVRRYKLYQGEIYGREQSGFKRQRIRRVI